MHVVLVPDDVKHGADTRVHAFVVSVKSVKHYVHTEALLHALHPDEHLTHLLLELKNPSKQVTCVSYVLT